MKIASRMIIAALAGTLAASPAFAEMMHFEAKLSGAQEVPPTTSTGTGTVEITYDTATKTLSWSGTYSGLTGPATMAHFHGPADAGKSAGVEVPLKTVANPLKGSAQLSDSQAADLKAGKLYLNIHTAANGGGEIRGQVLPTK